MGVHADSLSGLSLDWLTQTGVGGGGSGVFVNGKPVIVDGDSDSCICPRIGGSSDVNIG